MRVNKKNLLRTACFLLALGTLGAGLRCMKGCDTTPGKEGVVKAHIVNVATNDLAQVMVFAEDEGKNSMVFVKNFYREGQAREKISADMQGYFKKIEPYRGRTVTIRYHRDGVGDNIIDGIQ
ncbi:MAG: hypothetical protein EHM32_11320 [Spirochaetales bacterium]|nr:MAG: hypothetical protein EHM32_11320 [Spirochaetales bacterium]